MGLSSPAMAGGIPPRDSFFLEAVAAPALPRLASSKVILLHRLGFSCFPLNWRPRFNDVFAWLWTDTAGPYRFGWRKSRLRPTVVASGGYQGLGVVFQRSDSRAIFSEMRAGTVHVHAYWTLPVCFKGRYDPFFHHGWKSLKVMTSLVNHEEGTSSNETKGILRKREKNRLFFSLLF